MEGIKVCYDLIQRVMVRIDEMSAIRGGEAFSADVNRLIFAELRRIGAYYESMIGQILEESS